MLPIAHCRALTTRVAHCFVSTSRPTPAAALLLALAAWAAGAGTAAHAADPNAELLRQRDRERVQREQLEARPDVRLEAPLADEGDGRLPANETPCFPIRQLRLVGDAAERFQWALRAANPG